MNEREFATDVVLRLQQAGYQALFAGGCVRDELLQIEPADYDIATSATPEQVKQRFRRCHGFGASFGVVEVLGPRDEQGEWLKVQVATFRSDGTYSDGRRPDSVRYSSPEEDAARRDFTINGMFLDPIQNRIIDYVGGEADLHARNLRAIGNAHERFTEDKLRILRAVRMAARFELSIDSATEDAARAMVQEIAAVSQERIAEELRKMFQNRHRARSVELMHTFGLLPHILPGVPHDAEAITRIHRAITLLPADASFELTLSMLLLGFTKKRAQDLARRLKLSNAENERIAWLVEHADALHSARTMPKHRLYPLLIQPGIAELLQLHRARAIAENPSVAELDWCEAVLRETPVEVLNPVPLLTGDDLARLGYRPGPAFKRILEEVRAAQLDGNILSTDEAEALARNIAEA